LYKALGFGLSGFPRAHSAAVSDVGRTARLVLHGSASLASLPQWPHGSAFLPCARRAAWYRRCSGRAEKLRAPGRSTGVVTESFPSNGKQHSDMAVRCTINC
jgi:hypothetical protein